MSHTHQPVTNLPPPLPIFIVNVSVYPEHGYCCLQLSFSKSELKVENEVRKHAQVQCLRYNAYIIH